MSGSPVETQDFREDKNEDHGNEDSTFVDVCTHALSTTNIDRLVNLIGGGAINEIRTESPTMPIA